MSAPDLPRFKVSSVTGYSGGPTGAKRSITSYYVLDTWDVHRVVAAFPAPTRGGGRELTPRASRVRDRCAELEAWHATEMANDPA